jgi:hypothetical protein
MYLGFIREFLTEGARTPHPEDLVFQQGSAAALSTIKSLEQLGQNAASKISLKWDGSPAIIFGRRPEDGAFTMNYKEWIGKTGGQVTDPKQLAEFIASRGPGKEGLIERLIAAWEPLSRIVPANFSGFVQGDLMWVGTLTPKDGQFVFRPNPTGVTYYVAANTDLGKKIATSKVGIAVHTYLQTLESGKQPLDGTGGLDPNGPVTVLTADMKVPGIKLNVDLANKATAWVKKHAVSIDEFINPANLAGIKGIGERMMRFINTRVDAGNFNHLVDEWLNWIPTNATSAKQGNAMLEYSKAHADGLVGLFGTFLLITELKMSLKTQLDQAANNGPIKAVPGHEGYVLDGATKLVDRMEFSRMNRAGRTQ